MLVKAEDNENETSDFGEWSGFIPIDDTKLFAKYPEIVSFNIHC